MALYGQISRLVQNLQIPTSAFTHTRLRNPSTYTRVLHLEPSKSSDEQLRCSLSVTPISPADQRDPSGEIDDGPPPVFEALSYVWGAPRGDRELLCDGKILLITENCEAALRRLRLEDQLRTLWVDSICIDQSNSPESIQERNIKVRMMAQIYSSASRVLIWLGEGSPELHYAFKAAEAYPTDETQPSVLRHLNQKVFDFFLYNPWNWRVWTIQEVACAKDPLLIAGSHSIPWTTLYAAVLSHCQFDDSVPQSMISSLGLLAHGTLATKSVNYTVSLITYLQASDPRDKVFSLYHFFCRDYGNVPAPDYTLSVQRVYADATAMCIADATGHKIIYRAQVPTEGRDPTLPSWVMDWNHPGEISTIWHAFSYNATKESSIEFHRPSTWKISLMGKKFALMKDIGPRMPWPDWIEAFSGAFKPPEDENSAEWQRVQLMSTKLAVIRTCQRWITMALDLDLYGDELSTREAIFTLLNLPKTWGNEKRLYESNPKLLKYYEYFHAILVKAVKEVGPMNLEMNMMARNMLNLSSIEPLDEGSPLTDEQLKINEKRRELAEDPNLFLLWIAEQHSTEGYALRDGLHVLAEYWANYSLFTTSTGHMGMAFHKIRPRDCVALISGFDVPIVLRPEGEEYKLISPAYVQGIMNGEAWDAPLKSPPLESEGPGLGQPNERIDHVLEEFVLV